MERWPCPTIPSTLAVLGRRAEGSSTLFEPGKLYMSERPEKSTEHFLEQCKECRQPPPLGTSACGIGYSFGQGLLPSIRVPLIM